MCAGGGPGSDAGLLDEFLREVINDTNDSDSDDNHGKVPHLSPLLQVGGASHSARPAGGRGGGGAGALAVHRHHSLSPPHHPGRGHHAPPTLNCQGLSG